MGEPKLEFQTTREKDDQTIMQERKQKDDETITQEGRVRLTLQ